MKWTRGVEFHVCTLQVKLAAELGGSTVHFLAGLNPFMKSAVVESNVDAHVTSQPVQSRCLLCRVILIDEVFMLSSQLLAEVENQIRNGVSDASRYKYDSAGRVREWGGINVGFIGDSYQLDCPEGTPLYKIPQRYVVDKSVKKETVPATRGLELMWDCVQGVTELTRPYRCLDRWWNSVLDEIRVSQLSNDNYGFLHGLETSVPGSWVGEAPE
eukprot:7717526-Pyramimonas_sp.AAC.1